MYWSNNRQSSSVSRGNNCARNSVFCAKTTEVAEPEVIGCVKAEVCLWNQKAKKFAFLINSRFFFFFFS